MKTMTLEQILKMQDLAIRTGNEPLRRTTWAALGYDSYVAFMPVTEGEKTAAVAKLIALQPTL